MGRIWNRVCNGMVTKLKEHEYELKGKLKDMTLFAHLVRTVLPNGTVSTTSRPCHNIDYWEHVWGGIWIGDTSIHIYIYTHIRVIRTL